MNERTFYLETARPELKDHNGAEINAASRASAADKLTKQLGAYVEIGDVYEN